VLSGAFWLLPPAVLPVPSRSGPEGPPRPFGAEPRWGRPAQHTDPLLARAQSRALLHGPFPKGGLARGISDGTLLLSDNLQTRTLALARIAATGSSTVRIPVNWRNIALIAPSAGFQARDPASAGYDFKRLDATVRSAAAAGLQPLLVVSHAPAFAEAPGRWPYAYPGSWAPSPMALGDFAAALARRYDGSFPDPLLTSATLPRVRLFQAWNEPNLPRYLEPQWIVQGARWSAFSPLLYRQMLNAFYAGVKSVQPTARVITAGLAPDGDPVGVGRMAPVPFLRAMLCLRAVGPPRRARCADPPRFDVLAYHPLSVGNPDVASVSSLDAAISDIAKVTGLLGTAERLHVVRPVADKPVWVTELNWESAPDAPSGVPPDRQARWISRALHRLWIAGVSLVQWQFLVDPYPGVRTGTETGVPIEYQRPAGLYSAGPGGDLTAAMPKPFLGGFSFPFDPLRLDRRYVRVWALLGRARESVELQQLGKGRRWLTVARLQADHQGVLNVLVALHGAGLLRLRSARGPVSAPAAPVRLG
jgi:hypothetical protein